MIYKQNGKYFLAIRSSLTAFEGEVDYHFKKNAYNTPEEFKELVVNLFEQKCLLKVNDDTIKFLYPNVILGHETSVFAELSDIPRSISSLHVENELFADMSNNQCELVLMLDGYPKKQFILTKNNEHRLRLLMENGNWVVNNPQSSFWAPSSLVLLGILFVAVSVLLNSVKKNST